MPSRESRLNHAVTAAIFRAEDADYKAAKLWDVVAKREAALYELHPKGTLESDIARRGIRSAKAKARARRRK